MSDMAQRQTAVLVPHDIDPADIGKPLGSGDSLDDNARMTAQAELIT